MRVMFYADAPTLTTGYGIVSYYLGKGLMARGFDVSWIGIQYVTGRPIPYEGGKIYAGDMPSVNQALRDFRPDVLIHIRDNWVFLPNRFPQAYSFKQYWDRYKFKQINYTPVQSEPLPPDFMKTVSDEAHFTITMTKWGMNTLIRQGADVSKVDYLYHGVDRNVFHPTKSESHEGKRFIFVGGNYDYRKNLPNLLHAFKLYKEKSGDKEAQLYLHTAPVGNYQLHVFMQYYGLEFGKDVMFKDMEAVANLGYGVDSKTLNDWYNWADVFISMSVAEGFNIPPLEAKAVGLPTILTEMPVHREIYSRFKHSYFIASRKLYPMVWGFEWLPYVDKAVELMMSAGVNKKVEDDVLEEFSWDKITDKLVRIINEVVR